MTNNVIYLAGITSWCNGRLPIFYPLRLSSTCTMQFILTSSPLLVSSPITQVEAFVLTFEFGGGRLNLRSEVEVASYCNRIVCLLIERNNNVHLALVFQGCARYVWVK